MSGYSQEEVDRKKSIFDSMGKRGQKKVMKMGYDKWDPFEEPKEPIEMRRDKTKRTSQELIREFLQSVSQDEYSNEYGGGAFDMCLGIINDQERYKGMYDFVCWYQDLLKKEAVE
ncbi:MAG: hypothetical protein HN379_02490 [Desulfobacteraceae bacterium]|jgi:hypothetical protein|nr:hypothetical protein [Desulfobacteraceae bacterium]